MQQCWQEEAMKRPCFKSLVQELDTMLTCSLNDEVRDTHTSRVNYVHI